MSEGAKYIDRKTQVAENKAEYKKPPTVKLIKKVIIKTGLSFVDFETFYRIPHGTIGAVLNGHKKLYAAHWHIIYLLDRYYKIKAAQKRKPKKSKNEVVNELRRIKQANSSITN